MLSLLYLGMAMVYVYEAFGKPELAYAKMAAAIAYVFLALAMLLQK